MARRVARHPTIRTTQISLIVLLTTLTFSTSAQALITFTVDKIVKGKSISYIKVMNDDGSDVRTITRGHHPTLSPDGKKIALFRSYTDLYIKDLTTNQLSKLSRSTLPGGIAWSPDSTTIALQSFSHNGLKLNLVLKNVTTRALTKIKTVTLYSSFVDKTQFSPDGKNLAFVIDRGDDSSATNIYRYDVINRSVKKLTDDDSSSEPVWGPNKIAYRKMTYSSSGYLLDEIWLMDEDGSNKQRALPSNKRFASMNPVLWAGDYLAVNIRTFKESNRAALLNLENANLHYLTAPDIDSAAIGNLVEGSVLLTSLRKGFSSDDAFYKCIFSSPDTFSCKDKLVQKNTRLLSVTTTNPTVSKTLITGVIDSNETWLF